MKLVKHTKWQKKCNSTNCLFLECVKLGDSGQITLATGETLLYSGHQEGAPHTEGVGFMLSKSAAKSLMEWKAISYYNGKVLYQTKKSINHSMLCTNK